MALTCPSCHNINPLEARFCARCGSEIASEMGPRDFTGSTLHDGRYQVEKKLGAGAVGAVYQAMDTQLKRGVALKVLHADMVSHATARTRMIREAQAIAGIDHPNVVRIHELFEDGEHLVLVLELVKGGTLADRLADGALDPEEAKGMMFQLLEGLEAIHAAGIVHRDIKPANVLITEKGLAKLTDFGVAHDQKGRAMTRAGARLGTPEYMAPEQVKGQEVDARTDLYACGVVLYQLLTGAVPFEGESDFEIFEGHVRGKLDLTALPATTPKPLRDTTIRALKKDLEKRFQSAEQMREGLNGLVGPVVGPADESISMEDPHTGHACPMCGTSVKKRRNDNHVLHCMKCGYSGEGSLWRIQKTGMDAIANLRFECGECAQVLEQKSNVIIARCGACGAKVLPRKTAGMKKKDKDLPATVPKSDTLTKSDSSDSAEDIVKKLEGLRLDVEGHDGEILMIWLLGLAVFGVSVWWVFEEFMMREWWHYLPAVLLPGLACIYGGMFLDELFCKKRRVAHVRRMHSIAYRLKKKPSELGDLLTERGHDEGANLFQAVGLYNRGSGRPKDDVYDLCFADGDREEISVVEFRRDYQKVRMKARGSIRDDVIAHAFSLTSQSWRRSVNEFFLSRLGLAALLVFALVLFEPHLTQMRDEGLLMVPFIIVMGILRWTDTFWFFAFPAAVMGAGYGTYQEGMTEFYIFLTVIFFAWLASLWAVSWHGQRQLHFVLQAALARADLTGTELMTLARDDAEFEEAVAILSMKYSLREWEP